MVLRSGQNVAHATKAKSLWPVRVYDEIGLLSNEKIEIWGFKTLCGMGH